MPNPASPVRRWTVVGDWARPAARRGPLAFGIVLGLFVAPAGALDLVYRKANGKTVGGDITKVTRTEVVVNQQVGNKEEVIPTNEIDHVEWEGEPAPLKLARGAETTGNLDESIRNFQEALKAAPAGRENLRAEMEYGLARTTAHRALASGENLEQAVGPLKSFVNTNRDSYRFFEAQLLLGDVMLAAGDSLTADISFRQVDDNAPWLDEQLAAKLGLARSALARGEAAAAKEIFDQVATADAKTASELARRLEGVLGQARALLAQDQPDQALEAAQRVIAEASSTETRVQAQAYLLQGDVYRSAKANPKAAVIAYLHVDVIPDFAGEDDLHAESLFQLAKLWPAIGETARGADAASRLQAEYPHSAWAKKLDQKPPG